MQGKAGTMDSKKLIAAIETTAKRENIFRAGCYKEEHAVRRYDQHIHINEWFKR